jgi:exosortase C (VPDSG-CTERM-specific)
MSDTAATNLSHRTGPRWRNTGLVLFVVALLAGFYKTLAALTHLAWTNELYSYILLIPAISIYLVWMDRRKLNFSFTPAPRTAIGLLLLGIALIATFWIGSAKDWLPSENDRLCLLTLSLLSIFCGGLIWFVGARVARSIAFPLAFLIFMTPMPSAVENAVIVFLQHASADAAYLLLKIFGMPVFRQDTEFTMPGVTIAVAPECSGVHSSLVLFVTGVLASYFLLRKPWTRVLLAASVIPLGILRNAVRIFTLAELAVHVNPNVLDSPLHHKGGPLFFAISMIPFIALIFLLRKYEIRRMKKVQDTRT